MAAPRANSKGWHRLRWPMVLVALLGAMLLLCLLNLFFVDRTLQQLTPALLLHEQTVLANDPVFTNDVAANGEAELPAPAFSHRDRLGLHQDLQTLSANNQWWTRLSLLMGCLNVCALAWLLHAWSRSEADRQRHARRQREIDQAAILTLLDEMEPVARGDLTVRATVSEALTGSLADAFNQSIGEIRWLVSTMDSSAGAVAQSVSRSHATARAMSRACNVQAREIHRSSNHLTAMSGAMTQLAELAAESSRKARKAVDSAQTGTDALDTSLLSLREARDSAEATLQLMMRLGENTDSIEARAAAVREVTRRTDLLALNSTIQVVSASSQAELDLPINDDGLTRLAAEVQELADILRTATQQITALTDTIGQDVDVTINAMQRTRDVLLSGIANTENAHRRLGEIDRLAQELQNQVIDMAGRTVKQTAVLRKLGSNMSVINDLTRQTAGQVKVNADELDQLHELAADLRASVAGFRLPTSGPVTHGDELQTGSATTTDVLEPESGSKVVSNV